MNKTRIQARKQYHRLQAKVYSQSLRQVYLIDGATTHIQKQRNGHPQRQGWQTGSVDRMWRGAWMTGQAHETEEIGRASRQRSHDDEQTGLRHDDDERGSIDRTTSLVPNPKQLFLTTTAQGSSSPDQPPQALRAQIGRGWILSRFVFTSATEGGRTLYFSTPV